MKKKSTQELLCAKPSVKKLHSRTRNPIYVLLDDVRSRFNVGAIFRTCDAALINTIFLGGITPNPPHKEIDKSALGATDVVPWHACPDAVACLRDLKSKGVSIVALELTHESVPYSEFEFSFPVCLVVGSEVNGISERVLAECDVAVDIPMLGRAVSLNVATACGVAIFEILRQYQSK